MTESRTEPMPEYHQKKYCSRITPYQCYNYNTITATYSQIYNPIKQLQLKGRYLMRPDGFPLKIATAKIG